MKVFELETANGRIFRVCVVNAAQQKRLFKAVSENKKKTYEIFTRVECIKNGIYSIADFEKLADTLV